MNSDRAIPVDFGPTAEDYSRHRAGFPPSFFARIALHGVGRVGQRILDLGTGTGSLARGLARRGAIVTGIDIAGPLLAEAARLDRAEHLSTRYVEAPAEATGLPSETFEVVTAGQSWHWFNRAVAANEASRLLVEDGIMLIAHFDWIPLPGNVVEATEALILRHNPKWHLAGGNGMYP